MLTAPLRTQILAQLGALRGFDFQQAVVELLYLAHHAEGFNDLRAVRDGGSDGLIVAEKCSIACYGPDHRTVSKLRTKLKDDYAKYAKNWRDRYPNWRVYINRQASPEEVKLVDSLHPGAELWGLQRIIQVVENLSFDRLIKFCRLLHIEDAFVARDFLRPLLDDLVAMKVTADPISYKNRAPDISLKIRENYPEDEAATIGTLIALTFEQQHAAETALAAYDEADLTRIKVRIVTDFAHITGVPGFHDRLRLLLDNYVAKYNPGGDDGLTQYIQGLLFLLFAQCLIGRRPNEEG